jgi:hypothetical protein
MSKDVHDAEFEDNLPKDALTVFSPEEPLAPPPQLIIEGHAFNEEDRETLFANASAALRVIEYDVFRLWTLLLKPRPLSDPDTRLLVTILRTRNFNPLYPDAAWARVVPRP